MLAYFFHTTYFYGDQIKGLNHKDTHVYVMVAIIVKRSIITVIILLYQLSIAYIIYTFYLYIFIVVLLQMFWNPFHWTNILKISVEPLIFTQHKKSDKIVKLTGKRKSQKYKTLNINYDVRYFKLNNIHYIPSSTSTSKRRGLKRVPRSQLD